jgi:CO/xanthine dehydrogenase FAD-binding subunit
LLVAIVVPQRSAQARSVFAKLGSRRYLVIAITMVALLLDVDANSRVVAAGIAVGSCSTCARRLPALEARLLGMRLAEVARLDIDAADLAPLSPIDDVRATAAYRLDATQTLLRRALQELAS